MASQGIGEAYPWESGQSGLSEKLWSVSSSGCVRFAHFPYRE